MVARLRQRPRGVDDGLVETESDAEPGSVRSYDLTSQDRIVRGRMPTLEMVNERFVRLWRIGLFNLLRRSADDSDEVERVVDALVRHVPRARELLAD